MARPTPRVVSEVCSLCGLDWKDHGKNPTAETCVKLLLDEVSSLNARIAVRPIINNPYPYVPVPYPVYPRPYYPQWYTTWGGSISASSTSAQSSLSSLSPQAITVKSGLS